MASITKRDSKTGKVTYQARARRKGYPLECTTFASRQEAKDWAAGVKGLMAQNAYVVDKDSRRYTLGQVLDEYLKQRVGDDRQIGLSPRPGMPSTRSNRTRSVWPPSRGLGFSTSMSRRSRYRARWCS